MRWFSKTIALGLIGTLIIAQPVNAKSYSSPTSTGTVSISVQVLPRSDTAARVKAKQLQRASNLSTLCDLSSSDNYLEIRTLDRVSASRLFESDCVTSPADVEAAFEKRVDQRLTLLVFPK